MTESAPAAAPPSAMQKYLAEALGTFVIVLFATGAWGESSVSTALAGGFAVLVMMYAAGQHTGGHFNPAVSLAHALSGRLGWAEAGVFIGLQFAGALVAALVLLLVGQTYYDENFLKLTASQISGANDADWIGVVLAGLFATFIFVWVYLAVTDRRREAERIPAPVVIGLAFAAALLFTPAITGTAVNPARALATGLFAGWDDGLKHALLYLVAGFAGAAIAGFIYPLLNGYDRERPVRAPRAQAQPQFPGQWGGEQQVAGGEAWQSAGQWGQPNYGQPGTPAAGQPGQPVAGGADPAGTQQWGAQPAADPNAGNQWGQEQPQANPWQTPPDEGRTQIRPPDAPN